MSSTANAFKAAKVPAVTFGFWVLKVLATTLGETGGDALSMSWQLGYLVSTCIFALLFFATVGFQVRASKFHPSVYWLTIITTTTVGTTLADFVTRSIGIGYLGGSLLLLTLLIASLFIWKSTTGSISISSISDTRSELFYWITIMFSQTLGTAVGDWTADTLDCGYLGSVGLFGGLLLLIAFMYWKSWLPSTPLFWLAFILTRPFGAVLGDFLDKTHEQGGLSLSRFAASGVILALMVVFGLLFPQKAATRSH